MVGNGELIFDTWLKDYYLTIMQRSRKIFQSDFSYLKKGDEVFMAGQDLDENDIFKVKVDGITPSGRIKVGLETFTKYGSNIKRGFLRPHLIFTNEVTTEKYLKTVEKYNKLKDTNIDIYRYFLYYTGKCTGNIADWNI